MKKLLILFTTILIIGSCKPKYYLASDLNNIVLIQSRAVNDRLDSVNIGTGPNTGTGDPLRTAFIKTNAAINTLDSLFTEGLRYGYFKGSASGKTQVRASAVAGGTVTYPANTGVIILSADTAAMLTPYILDSETDTRIADSLNARLAKATVAVTAADSTGISEGSYTSGYDFSMLTQRTDQLKGFQAMGNDIKAISLGSNIMPVTGQAINDGIGYLAAFYVDKTTTITGVWFMQNVQGDYTADNNNRIGFYSESAGVLTLRASTANDGDLWKGAPGYYKKAFSTPYSAPAGVYYVKVLYNSSEQVTGPMIGKTTINQPTAQLFTNSNSLGRYRTARTDLDASITLSDYTDWEGTVLWIGLY